MLSLGNPQISCFLTQLCKGPDQNTGKVATAHLSHLPSHLLLVLLGKRSAGGALPATAGPPDVWAGVGTATIPRGQVCSLQHLLGRNGCCHRKGLHKEGAKRHYITAISHLRRQRSQKHHQTLPGSLIPYSETAQKTVTGPSPAGKAGVRLLTCPEGKILFPGDRFMTCR